MILVPALEEFDNCAQYKSPKSPLTMQENGEMNYSALLLLDFFCFTDSFDIPFNRIQ